MSKKVIGIGKKSNGKPRGFDHQSWDCSQESRLAMIQMLIPVGLKAVEEALQSEVLELVGERYSRGGDKKRWGSNPGSVFLGDQKVRVSVPRIRDLGCDQEVPLGTYERLQSSQVLDEVILARVLQGLSQGRYQEAAIGTAETFGVSKSSVSKRFIEASQKEFDRFMKRDLSGHDFVAIFLDGKSFAKHQLVVALGVTIDGEKVPLGLVETASENSSVCQDFFRSLIARGLGTDNELLFVVDGAKGFSKAIEDVFKDKAFIQRCQWHKRENILKYLSKAQQQTFRRDLQSAYESPTYDQAKKKFATLRKKLKLINESAVNSLDEGFEETLTLHRLGLFQELGRSLKTTNCIENIMRQLERYTHRVSYWQTSGQRQRWVATALMDLEPRLNRIMGHQYLGDLRKAMKNETKKKLRNAA